MSEILKPTVPVFMFLVDGENKVYLQRRYQTGYLDGYYEAPAGKVDEGEFPTTAACREAFEEAGVIVDPKDTELFHAYFNQKNGLPWLGLMFRTRKWQGNPSIMEPEKCDDAGFFALDNLPPLTFQVHDAIAKIVSGANIEFIHYTD